MKNNLIFRFELLSLIFTNKIIIEIIINPMNNIFTNFAKFNIHSGFKLLIPNENPSFFEVNINIKVIINEKNLWTFIWDLIKVIPIQNLRIIEGKKNEKKQINVNFIMWIVSGIFIASIEILFGK